MNFQQALQIKRSPYKILYYSLLLWALHMSILRTKYNLIVILGPTASGKTTLAAHLARALDSEIISGDSRQIYRGMDIGTGKDLDDYRLDGQTIPYHLIDIADAGYKYNVYEYQRDFIEAWERISAKQKIPVLCGGTGLYIEAVLKGYKLVNVPKNETLRASLQDKNLDELTHILKQYKKLHNSTDTETKRRAIRAIEIAEYYASHDVDQTSYPKINPLIIGVHIDREARRNKISERLKNRIDEGMINEVKKLLNNGVSAEDLIYYGLEYKYVTQYVTGKISYDDMLKSLEIAIHQFAKRQMTWFRGMERRGTAINWIDVKIPLEKRVNMIREMLYVQ